MKNVKLLIKILFITFAFWFIFEKIPISEFKNIKIQNPFFLLLAFILFNFSQIISAKRVDNYLREIDINMKFKKQLILYYLGMFYNTLLPGGIGGDGYKAYKYQKQFKTGYKKIIKALLIDRISGLFAILFILSILSIFTSIKYALLLTLFLISPFILYLIHKLFFIEFKKSFLKSFIYSLIIQSLQGIAFILILLSIGIKIKLIDLTILFFISSIISVIPVSIGGIGLRELTFLYGSEIIHLNPAPVIMAGFLFFLINLLSSAIGGIFILKERDV